MPVFTAFQKLIEPLRGGFLPLVKSSCFVSFHRILPGAEGETQLHIDGGYRPAIQNGGKNCPAERQEPKNAQKGKAPNGAK